MLERFSLAFFLGLLAFFSPCILSLMPLYFSYLGIVKQENSKISLVLFSLGFMVVFSIFGIILEQKVCSPEQVKTITRLGGVFLILLGLNRLGIFLSRGYLHKAFWKVESFLNSLSEKVLRIKHMGYWNLFAIAFGALSALLWTPCSFGLLMSVSLYALSFPDLALVMMLGYSLGIVLPLTLLGFFSLELLKKLNDERSKKLLSLVRDIFFIILGTYLMTL